MAENEAGEMRQTWRTEIQSVRVTPPTTAGFQHEEDQEPRNAGALLNLRMDLGKQKPARKPA